MTFGEKRLGLIFGAVIVTYSHRWRQEAVRSAVTRGSRHGALDQWEDSTERKGDNKQANGHINNIVQ